MPRRPKPHYAGAVYHALSRGVNGEEIFQDDFDREVFLEALQRVRSETPFSLLAYCLMGNHFHFAIRVGQNPLATVMQRLLTSYSRAFNKRHGREGHLFQARYKSYLCVDDRYLTALVRYIHQNPVRAGLCSAPGGWAWSSYRALLSKSDSLLVDAESLRELAPTAMATDLIEKDFSPWPVEGEPALLRIEVEPRSLEMIAQSLPGRPTLADLQSTRESQSRRSMATAAVAEGHTLTEIARWMGCSVVAVHRWVRPKVKVKT